MKTRLLWLACAFVPIVAHCSGCGGGGGGGSSSGARTTSFAVTMNWPAYNGSAPAGDPAASQSACLILKGANTNGTDAQINDNRKQQTAYTETETFLNIKQGPTELDVIYYAGLNCMPPTLATGATPIPDPTQPGPVVSIGTIASLAIAPNQTVGVAGTAKALLYTAYNSSGNVVAVPANAIINWAVVSGVANLQISGGLAKGLAVGAAQVTVNINQITSPAQAVQVVAGTGNYANVTSEVELGRSQLNDLLRGQTVINETNLQVVEEIFANAYNLNPTNNQAAFGFGVTSVAYNAQVLYDSTQGRVAAASSANSTLSAAATKATLWNSLSLSGQTMEDVLTMTQSAPFSIPAYAAASKSTTRSMDINQVRTAMSGLKSAIDFAIPAIEYAASPGFNFTIADYRAGASPTATLAVDLGEAQTYLAALYAVRAVLNIALSYNFDYGSFNFSQNVGNVFASQIANQTPLPPDSYLPTLPFVTLESDGNTRWAAAQNDLSTAADRVLSALIAIQNRLTQSGHIINGANLDYATISTEVTRFKQDLTSPDTRLVMNSADQNLGYSLTINLNAWFTNPPQSLRSLLPTYRVLLNQGGSGENYLVAAASDYADTTQGGLFVNPPAGIFNTVVNAGYLSPNTLQYPGDTVLKMVSQGLPFMHLTFTLTSQGGAGVTIQ